MNKRLICVGLFLFVLLNVLAQESLTHTVKTGETITSICEQYGISKDDLTSLNPSLKNYVYTGQVLNIPNRKKNETVEQEVVEVTKEVPSESINMPDQQKSNQYLDNETPTSTKGLTVRDPEESQKTDNLDLDIDAWFNVLYKSKPEGQHRPWGLAFGAGPSHYIKLSDKSSLVLPTDLYFETFGSSITQRYGYDLTFTHTSSWKVGIAMPAMVYHRLGNSSLFVGWGCFAQYALFGAATVSIDNSSIGGEKEEKTTKLKDGHGADRFSYGVVFRMGGLLFDMIPVIFSFRVQYSPGGGEPIKGIGL